MVCYFDNSIQILCCFKYLKEEIPEISINLFFKLGDFLLVGVMQPVIRMYDITTSQCFVASNPAHQHSDSVTSIKWSPDGKLYASASIDGMIKIWDGVSSSCISTFPRAHDGAPVCSVQFARNGKYRI